MTQHVPQSDHGHLDVRQVLHLGKEVRFDALQNPANGTAENARRQAERAAGLSARIRRHIAEMGYSNRPPALIAPGALA